MELVDDLNWEESGVSGYNDIETKNIYRIVFEGVNFENAFGSTLHCSQSRARSWPESMPILTELLKI